jgi:hypothetical protein
MQQEVLSRATAAAAADASKGALVPLRRPVVAAAQNPGKKR